MTSRGRISGEMSPSIAITGVSGRFPRSGSVEQLTENLFNGVDMVSSSNMKHPFGLKKSPKCMGKLEGLHRFDATFFGISDFEANLLDPQLRQLLQSTFEAIVDSGMTLQEIQGPRTGFYYGSCFQEIHSAWSQNPENLPSYRNSYESLVPHIFNLKGPVVQIDTACSSAQSALNEAFIAIKAGLCDRAIVAGYNVCLTPYLNLELMDLQMISPGGKSKCLDKSADGYARSETIVCLLLQKSSEARRIYSEIANSRANSDGFKPEGPLFPSIKGQTKLMRETYDQIKLDPKNVGYIEAHVTGTQAGDAVETSALDQIFCKEKRDEPLLVGCLKSNIGHSEGSSGVNAVVKTTLIFQKGKIPPNLHFKEANPRIEPLIKGTMKPVVSTTPFNGKYIGINSFGFGGSNVHTIVKNEMKKSLPESFNFTEGDSRLICIPGRTPEAVEYVQKFLTSHQKQITKQFLHLMDIYSKTERMPFRGYSLAKDEGGVVKVYHEPPHAVETKPKPSFTLVLDPNKVIIVEEAFKKIDYWDNIVQKFVKSSKKLGMNFGNLIYRKSQMNGIGKSSFESIVAVFCISKFLTHIGMNVKIVLSGASMVNSISEYLINSSDEEDVLQAASNLVEKHLKTKMSAKNDGPNKSQTKIHGNKKSKIEKSNDPENRNSDIILEVLHKGLELSSRRLDQPSDGNKTSEAGPFVVTLDSLLRCLGQAYSLGSDIDLTKLYSNICYPVPVDTLSLNSLIKWDHSKRFKIYQYPEYFNLYKTVGQTWTIDVTLREYSFLLDHKIDGSAIFPASGYLMLAWLSVTMNHAVPLNRYGVRFTDVKLLRATLMTDKPLVFHVGYMQNSGKFSIKVGKEVAVEGKIFLFSTWDSEEFNASESTELRNDSRPSSLLLESKNIYKELRVRGYDYGPAFQCLVEAGDDGRTGSVKWSDGKNDSNRGSSFNKSSETELAAHSNWITFVDSLLQLGLLVDLNNRKLLLPIGIDSLEYWPGKFIKKINEFNSADLTDKSEPILPVFHNVTTNTLGTDGLTIRGITCANKARRSQNPLLETHQFIAYMEKNPKDLMTESYLESYRNQCQMRIESAKDLLETNDGSFSTDDSKHSLLKLLSEKSEKNSVEKPDENLQNKIDAKPELSSLQSDILVGNGLLTTERFLRPFVDLFCFENSLQIRSKRISIIEYGDQLSSLRKPIVNFLGYSAIDVKSYEVYQSSEDTVESRATRLSSRASESYDLIIINKSLIESAFFNTNLTSLINSLSPFGMVLILSSKPSLAFDGSQLKGKDYQSLSDESEVINSKMTQMGWVMLSKRTMFEPLVSIRGMIFKRKVNPIPKYQVIRVNSMEYGWVTTLQEALKKDQESRIWLISNQEECSGILGLFRCLSFEDFGHRLRCIEIRPGAHSPDSNIHDIDLERSPFTEILEKDLRVNVYDAHEGWGNYHHFVFQSESPEKPQSIRKATEDVILQCQAIGDLGSLTWVGTSLRETVKDEDRVDVVYSPLNFKDIMLASGRLTQIRSLSTRNSPAITSLGYEYAGFDCRGNRVMGIVTDKALATIVSIDLHDLLWKIPSNWSFEDAATVPLVYCTVIYGLIMRGGIKRGESILIHAGSGGVGLAALNVCLFLDCKIYTTVGTKAKHDFLLEKFPQLTGAQIFNSRDTTFEDEILKATDGRGVDLILNSLSEDKLQAGLRCLARGGRFIEIGKYDMVKDNTIELGLLDEGKSFHAIAFDHVIAEKGNEVGEIFTGKLDAEKKVLSQLMAEGIESGMIKPLPRTVFEMKNVQEAFRYMANGKHIGKVVIKIGCQDENSPRIPLDLEVKNIIQFPPHKAYMIIGGFGGIGLELACWMADNGARNIIINSRSGPKSSYHEYSLKRLRVKGVNVVISQDDFEKYENVVSFIESSSLPVGGFFNAAGVLKDGLFMNLTDEDFKKVSSSKIDITMNFDKAFRQLRYPSLDYFVVFSSIVSGRGNLGQANYGLANSFLESLCDKRRKDKLPGLALQLGAVGDVGMVVDTFGDAVKNIGGTVPQRIFSIFEVLGQAMQSGSSVVASTIFAQSLASSAESSEDVIKELTRILGIKDFSTLDKSTSLSQLGMDSLMAVEIQQIMERRFEVNLSMDDIRDLKISDLTDFENKAKPKTQTNVNFVK